MAIVLAIDAGTTGVRTIAVDDSGQPVATSYREFPQYFPRPGWVEHGAEEIWGAVAATLRSTVAQLGEAPQAIGITNQRETLVAWDAVSSRPRHPAIVWQDRRTAARCDELRGAGHEDLVRQRTGLVLDPYFSATKAEWLLGPGGVTADRELRLGTIDSWLVWKLTGGASHVTDVTNASRTMLFDIDGLDWSGELLDLFGVPRHVLPDVVASSGTIAVTSAGLPVPAGVPISGIAGDQQASLFGQGCTTAGMVKNTYGTGSFVLMNVGAVRPGHAPGLLTTVAWSLDTVDNVTYAVEGSIFATGAAVQWLRDGLGVIDEAAEIGPLAESVDDTGGVYLVPAFAGLGSPWWDPHARGALFGLTRGTGRAHLARATVESMAFQTRDVVEAMSAATGLTARELRVDGGASAIDLLLRLQADQLGVRVVRSTHRETTALGAAYLAGLAVGIWTSPDEISERWVSDARVDTVEDRTAANGRYRRWLAAVERSRGWDLPAEE